MTQKLKSFAIPLITIAGLLASIMWMAGAFDTKIQPAELASKGHFQGDSLTLKYSTHQNYEHIPATIRSKQTTLVASRILAPIKAIHVKAGDLVNKGDVLIVLDNRNNRSNVAQSRANINVISANLHQAKSHYLRTQSLYDKESVTKAQLEQANSRYNSLKAQLASSQQQLNSSQTTSSYSKIKAHFSARVIDRFAEVGDMASPGVKLLTLYNPNSLRVDMNVRESLALSLKIGQQLKTEIPALNQTIKAIIEEIVPAADTGARSFLVKAKITHNGQLLPGMFAKVHLPTSKQQQLRIPNHYIKQIGQLDIVWVMENKQVIRRFVRVGEKLAEKTVIISGLSVGEQLVLPPKKD